MDPIQRPNRPTVPSWDMLQLMPSTLSMVISDCDPTSTDCSDWQLAIHAAFPGGGTSFLLDLTGMRIQGAGVTGATEWYIFKDSAIDRKSTRLNSSHSSISYAVFCLKRYI